MVVLPGGGDPSRNFESMLLSVMTASALFGIAMDQVSPYSVARARLRVPTRHSVCALGKVSWKKGGQDEGEDTYTALVSWLIAAGGFVHEAVALTPNDGTGGRGLVAARDIARGEQLIVVERRPSSFLRKSAGNARPFRRSSKKKESFRW